MNWNYTVYLMLGREKNTNSKSAAKKSFEKNLEAIYVKGNGLGHLKRKHKRVGSVHSGIRGVGNIKIYECSDTKQLITNTGELKDNILARFENISKNRTGKTFYFEI